MAFFKETLKLFGGIRASYAGVYTSSSPEIREIKKEIKDIRIPSIKNDRINLKSDIDNTIDYFKKATEERLSK